MDCVVVSMDELEEVASTSTRFNIYTNATSIFLTTACGCGIGWLTIGTEAAPYRVAALVVGFFTSLVLTAVSGGLAYVEYRSRSSRVDRIKASQFVEEESVSSHVAG